MLKLKKKRKKKRKKKLKKLKKLQLNLKNKIKTNQYGWENQQKSKKKNMPVSINH